MAYADSIEPARKARDEKHRLLQAEYNEMFAELDKQIEKEEATTEEKVLTKAELDARLRDEAIKNGAEIFEFVSPDGERYCYVCNVDEIFSRNLRKEVELLPSAFVNKYLKFMLSSPRATYEYKKAIALVAEVPDFAKQQLMAPDDYRSVSANINRDFGKKYRKILVANDQALAERLLERLDWNPKFSKMIAFDTSNMLEFASSKMNIEHWTPEERSKIEADYRAYSSPVENKSDIRKITEYLTYYIGNIEPDLFGDRGDSCDDLIRLISANVKQYPGLKSLIAKIIRYTKFIEQYGGSAKILLKEEVPVCVKNEKSKLMFDDLLATYPGEFMSILTLSLVNINKYVHVPSLKSYLISKALEENNSEFN